MSPIGVILMHVLFEIILVLICIYSILKERNLYNPIFIFSGIWFVAMFLSSLQLYDLNATSEYAYTVAFIGVVFFTIGALIRYRASIKSIRISQVEDSGTFKFNYRFLFVFYTLVLIFTAVLASSSIALLRRGVSMETIRFNYRNVEAGLVIDNNLFYAIENYIVQPAVFASVAIIPVLTGSKSSRMKWIVLLELLLLNVLYIFVSGARSFLIDIAFLFVIYLLINKQYIGKFRENFSKIPKFVTWIIVFGAIGVVIYFTQLRKGDDRTIVKEFYRYISISFPLLDSRLSMASAQGHVFTHGWTFLHGFTKPFFYIIRHLTHLPYPSGLSEAMTQIAANNDFIYVGGGRANSFVTIFYYMFMDFGIVGVVLGCFLYGYFCQSIYKKMKGNPNRRNQTIFLLMIIGVFLSFVRFHFTAHRYVNAFVIVYFSFLSENINRQEVEH